MLIDEHDDINILNSRGQSPLEILIGCNTCTLKNRRIKSLLEWHADPNHVMEDGISVFHHILSMNDTEVINACLVAGANVHSPNALIVAIKGGWDVAVKCLLENGRLSQFLKEEAYNYVASINHVSMIWKLNEYIPKHKQKRVTITVV